MTDSSFIPLIIDPQIAPLLDYVENYYTYGDSALFHGEDRISTWRFYIDIPTVNNAFNNIQHMSVYY